MHMFVVKTMHSVLRCPRIRDIRICICVCTYVAGRMFHHFREAFYTLLYVAATVHDVLIFKTLEPFVLEKYLCNIITCTKCVVTIDLFISL